MPRPRRLLVVSLVEPPPPAKQSVGGAQRCGVRVTYGSLAWLVVLCVCAMAQEQVRPMCDASGCGESPVVPTPRTVYSLRKMSQNETWHRTHAENVRRSDAFFSEEEVERRRGQDALVFLGDSIFESFEGNGYGEPVARAEGVPEVFRKYYPNALCLAIAGDSTQHLLWRLPRELKTARSATFVVLIGTNNLGNGHAPTPTVDGVRAVVDWLLEFTQGRVVLLGLLPRGPGKIAALCPPRCRSDGSPFSSFSPAIDHVNRALARHFSDNSRVLVVSHCGDAVFRPARQRETRSSPEEYDRLLRSDLMPDLLHPNARGHALLAQCLLPSLLSSSPSSES